MQQDTLNNKTTVYVEFYIGAYELNFLEIAELLDVTSYERRRKETFVLKEFAKDYWWIKTETEYSEDINIQLEKITAQLIDKEEKIKKICETYQANCGFTIIIHLENDYTPAMYLEKEFIQFAAAINASIGFDFI